MVEKTKHTELQLQSLSTQESSDSDTLTTNPTSSDKNVVLSRAPDADISVPAFDGELYPFQRATVAYALRNRKVIIGDPTGTGKTISALAAAAALRAKPAIVVSPKSLVPMWAEEVDRFVSSVYEDVRVIDSIHDPVPRADLTVLSYGMLSFDGSRNSYYLTRMLRQLRPELIIADEAHSLRNRSIRSEVVEWIGKNVDNKFFLTGTPIVRDRTDAERMSSLLETDVTANSEPRDLNYNMRGSCYIRHDRETVLSDLPERLRRPVRTDISNRDYYNALQERYRHELTEKAGFRALYEFRKAAAIGKLDYIEDLVEDVNGPVALFAIHRDVQSELEKRFPNAACVLGRLSTNRRHEEIERFQNGNSDVIICAIGPGPEQSPCGVGVELTRAQHGIFCEIGWTHAHLVQAGNRVHRLGQENPVTLWYTIGKNTIDEKVWRLVEERRILTEDTTEGSISPSEIADLIYGKSNSINRRTNLSGWRRSEG